MAVRHHGHERRERSFEWPKERSSEHRFLDERPGERDRDRNEDARGMVSVEEDVDDLRTVVERKARLHEIVDLVGPDRSPRRR